MFIISYLEIEARKSDLHYWSKYEHVYKSYFELNVLSTICFSNQLPLINDIFAFTFIR